MDVESYSPTESRRSSRSHSTLIVRLKLPPRALAMATSIDPHVPLQVSEKGHPVASPFAPSSPPTIASSPAPGTSTTVPKKRGGPGTGRRSKPGPAPGSGVFSLANDVGGGSGAGTPVPTVEKERAKPGPKANPGGINAGLRALDRTGKRTRRWKRVQYPVQTISGYRFYFTTWVVPGIITPSYSADFSEGENAWNDSERDYDKLQEQDVTKGSSKAVAA
jgi:INO80 complex subunit Ies4